ncbi:hypothetical protein GCM10009836_56440 [Pseudonocardia ailaonensis]|uniref:Ferredoxin n=1 Tax=Pseudonocardia ailaonensis TaxID=367279 RepID=A0ABN2NH03_9PSEU
MKLHVEWTECEGHGMCVQHVPELVDLDDEGTLTLLREDFGEPEAAAVRSAVAACPKAALSIGE